MDELNELIAALVELRDEPDPIAAAKRCPDLQKAAQGVLARLRVEKIGQAVDLPGMNKTKVAAKLGINRQKIYRRAEQHSVTRS